MCLCLSAWIKAAPALLTKASIWAKDNFSPGSAPDTRTIKKWIRQGVIAGQIIGDTAYIEDGKRIDTVKHKGFKLK